MSMDNEEIGAIELELEQEQQLPDFRAPAGEVHALIFCRDCGANAGVLRPGGLSRTDVDPDWKKVHPGEVSILCEKCGPDALQMGLQYVRPSRGHIEYHGLVVHAASCPCRECVAARYLEGGPAPRTAI